MGPRRNSLLERLLSRGNAGEKFFFVVSIAAFSYGFGYYNGAANSSAPPALSTEQVAAQTLKDLPQTPDKESSIFNKRKTNMPDEESEDTIGRRPANTATEKEIEMEMEESEEMAEETSEKIDKKKKFQVVAGRFPGFKKSKELLNKLRKTCPKAWIMENKTPNLSYSVMCSYHTSRKEAEIKLKSLKIANARIVEM